MPINLTITGDHMTDVVAEVVQFANMVATPGGVIPKISGATAVTAQQLGQIVTSQVQDPESFTPEGISTEAPAEEKPAKKETVKKWPAKRQLQAIKDMVDAGEVDEEAITFMTKANADKARAGVERVLAERAKVVEEKQALLDEVNNEPAATPEETITIEELHNVVNKLVRDKDGNPDPDKMDKVFAVVDEFDETDGRPKIANIDESRYIELRDRLQDEFGS